MSNSVIEDQLDRIQAFKQTKCFELAVISRTSRSLSSHKICGDVTSHVIGCSDFVDLWVIKIKKPMILCARSTSISREQSTKHGARTCEKFVYSIVK